MYKKIVLSLVVSLSLLSIVSAQKTTQENNNSTGNTSNSFTAPKIDEDITNELNTTSMRFCIDGFESDKLSRIGKLTLQPGKSQDICMVFVNNTQGDKEFTVGFSEGLKNWGDTIVCDQNMDDNLFLHMIDMPDTTRKIMVASGGNTVSNFKIKIPTTTTGNIYGCVAYYLPNSYSKKTGDVFWMLIRKIAPIEIIITWGVYRLWRWDDSKDVYVNHKNSILKVIVGILAIWIMVSIVQATKKKEKHPKNK